MNKSMKNRRSYRGKGNPAYRTGLHKSPTWFSWTFMKQRCNNPLRSDYKYYGGRGIKYCEEWNEFAIFVRDMGIRPKGKTLDRIDNNSNYSPMNCRWATKKQQSKNKRKRETIPERDLLGRFSSHKDGNITTCLACDGTGKELYEPTNY